MAGAPNNCVHLRAVPVWVNTEISTEEGAAIAMASFGSACHILARALENSQGIKIWYDLEKGKEGKS